MTKYRFVDVVRDPADGTGQASVTVTLKKKIDNSTITTDGSDANGRAEMAHDTVGYPGPAYATASVGATTRVRSGDVWGQLGGLIWTDDISDVFQAGGIGVMPSAGSELACSASGANMNITVAAGMALLKDGLPYVLDASTTVTLSNGDGANPRIDRVVLRLTREEQSEQGKILLMAIAGTPDAIPAAPALTQASATWDLSLCQVAVAQSATTVSNGNITDERTWCWRYPLTTRGDLLHVDSTGKPNRLAVGNADEVLMTDGIDIAWSTLTTGSLPTGIPATSIADGSISNTEFQYLNNVSSNLQTQLNAKAATSHTHAATDIGNGDVDNTELSYLNGVTSAVQTQISANASNITNIISYLTTTYLDIDDSVTQNTSTSTYVDILSADVSVPILAASYTIECLSLCRATHSTGGQVQIRLVIDGTNQSAYDKNCTSSSGASILQAYGTKSAVTSGSKTIKVQMRCLDAGTSTVSNVTLTTVIRPTAG